MQDPLFTSYIDLNVKSPFSSSLCLAYLYYCVRVCGCVWLCITIGLYEINIYQFASIVSNNIWMWKLTKQNYFLLTRKDSVRNLSTAWWCNAIWQYKFNSQVTKIRNWRNLINWLKNITWFSCLRHSLDVWSSEATLTSFIAHICPLPLL